MATAEHGQVGVDQAARTRGKSLHAVTSLTQISASLPDCGD
jgi:hypothetical protein